MRDLRSWCAGIFDADGCFGLSLIQNARGNGLPYLTTYGTVIIREEVVVDIFQELYGGTKLFRKSKVEGHSDTHQWRATAKVLDRFIDDIKDCLVLKRAQADVIIEARRVRSAQGWQMTPERLAELQTYKARMNALNKRGVGKPPEDANNYLMYRKLIPGENVPG